MKKFVLLLLVTPAFAAVHYASRTAAPTAQLAYKGVKSAAKLASYPVRHPKKTVKGAVKGVKEAVVTAI